ncbi:MAG: T9SS type A sorting domain-containing protein, partial [Bacteroidota bacterium]
YTGLNADIWRIDDVVVDSPDYSNDMSVESIRPEFCLLNTSCTPTVTVKNVGQNIENNYSVNLTIDGTTYDETVTVTDPISPAEKKIVEFPDWTPLNNVNHIFNATLTLSGDANTSNNNLLHECVIFSSSDYTGKSVYSIEYQQNKTFHLSTLTGDRTWIKAHPFSYPQELAAMTYMNGTIVAVQRDVCDVFVMSPNGDFYNVGNIDADYIHGIAYDEVNDILYGVGWPTYDWDDHLFIIDENWNLTDLGAFSNRSWIMGLAANGQGELYAISIDDGTLFTIDPATMQTTTIGDIDGLQYSMQIQDIGFDREKNDLYGTLALGVGQILAKIDTNDASLTIINNYGFDSSFGACAPIPSNPASVDSFENELFTIYPNPSNGIFTFTSENILQGESLIEIIDVTGKRVYTFSFNNKLNSSVNIDLSNENSGIYFVKILNQNKCFTQKLIKQ